MVVNDHLGTVLKAAGTYRSSAIINIIQFSSEQNDAYSIVLLDVFIDWHFCVACYTSAELLVS